MYTTLLALSIIIGTIFGIAVMIFVAALYNRTYRAFCLDSVFSDREFRNDAITILNHCNELFGTGSEVENGQATQLAPLFLICFD